MQEGWRAVPSPGRSSPLLAHGFIPPQIPCIAYVLESLSYSGNIRRAPTMKISHLGCRLGHPPFDTPIEGHMPRRRGRAAPGERSGRRRFVQRRRHHVKHLETGNQPKDSPDERIGGRRAGNRAVWGAPIASTGPQNLISSMAPIDQYLMDRNAEIALARSAAPESISRDAEGLGPRTAWVRNRSKRQEWFRVCRGTDRGCPHSMTPSFGTQAAGPDLL